MHFEDAEDVRDTQRVRPSHPAQQQQVTADKKKKKKEKEKK